MEEVDVATAFLRSEGDVLLCRRPEDEPTYPGEWGVVTGYVKDHDGPDAAAFHEVREETGVPADALSRVRSGPKVQVSGDAYHRAIVLYPVLFDCAQRTIDPSEELDAVEWISPTDILRRDTVPCLWDAYESIAPTVRSIAADDEHGASYLSIRALEVLRDRAGLLAVEGEDPATARDELGELGRRLRTARPGMAVLRNRVNRALATGGDDPTAIESAAIDGIDRALAADRETAKCAADLIEDLAIVTLSRSETVLEALGAGTASRVYVAESRPGTEGVAVAEQLADVIPVILHTDAAVASILDREPVDAVLVGADTILPDGRVINKTGTYAAALAASAADVPFYVVAACDKVTTQTAVNIEHGEATAVYDGEADIDVHNPTFDVTPPTLIDGYVTERGLLDVADLDDLVDEFRSFDESDG